MRQVRTFFILSLALACLVLNACSPPKPATFGIYLLRDAMVTAKFQAANLQEIALEDQAFIADADIVSYDKDTHAIELVPAAYQRVLTLFQTPVDVDGLPFVVCVGEERIYGGAFWTPVSSLSFNGVVIMQPFDQAANVIQLSLGYPVREAFTGLDPRGDERIIKALKMAGKLK
jgi:hypothetical protein